MRVGKRITRQEARQTAAQTLREAECRRREDRIKEAKQLRGDSSMKDSLVIYLAGPIQGCSDSECNNWRDEIISKMEGWEYRFLNPMDRDYRDYHKDISIVDQVYHEVVQLDKRDIDNSDIVFANVPQPSAGTSMELLYAWERSKVVVVICPDDYPSPWVLYHSTKIVKTIDEGIEWIKKYVR